MFNTQNKEAILMYRVSHKSSITGKNKKRQNKSFYLKNLLNMYTITLNAQI
jgi:hypothetical protein